MRSLAYPHEKPSVPQFEDHCVIQLSVLLLNCQEIVFVFKPAIKIPIVKIGRNSEVKIGFRSKKDGRNSGVAVKRGSTVLT